MVFPGKKKMKGNLINLQINGQTLERVHKTKFLGMIIDEKLTFKDHISYVSSKVAKGIGIIKKSSKSN